MKGLAISLFFMQVIPTNIKNGDDDDGDGGDGDSCDDSEFKLICMASNSQYSS